MKKKQRLLSPLRKVYWMLKDVEDELIIKMSGSESSALFRLKFNYNFLYLIFQRRFQLILFFFFIRKLKLYKRMERYIT